MDPTQLEIQSLVPKHMSRKRIKSYLHKEYSSNKYSSIRDYQQMMDGVTQQRFDEFNYL